MSRAAAGTQVGLAPALWREASEAALAGSPPRASVSSASSSAPQPEKQWAAALQNLFGE